MTQTEKQLLPRVARMEYMLGIIPKEGATITERVEVISKANEVRKRAGSQNSEYIDQPSHDMYQVHKAIPFVVCSILMILSVPLVIYHKEQIDKAGSGFGLTMTLAMIVVLYWIAVLYEWIKVWVRNKRKLS